MVSRALTPFCRIAVLTRWGPPIALADPARLAAHPTPAATPEPDSAPRRLGAMTLRTQDAFLRLDPALRPVKRLAIP